MADNLARKWFSLGRRVVYLEAFSIAIGCFLVVVLGSCISLAFLHYLETQQASGVLRAALALGLVSCLFPLAYACWVLAGWLGWDAFETNGEAVDILVQQGFPATEEWHLSKAEQELIAWLWSPSRAKMRKISRLERI